MLAYQVKMYYGLRAGLKFNLVRLMNNSPEEFRHMDLIAEFENLKKDIVESREANARKSWPAWYHNQGFIYKCNSQ